MKKLLLILLCLPMIGFGQLTYVPDDNFEAYLENNGMGDGILLNDSVLTSSINTVLSLNVSSLGISDLTGIEDFTDLSILYCYMNNLSNLDISANLTLNNLSCYLNQLTSVDVSINISLTHLSCGDNTINTLDVSNNLNLEELNCHSNQLTTLDITSNVLLHTLYCSNNQLTSLNLSNNIDLTDLWCSDNLLVGLDLSNNVSLLNLNTYNNDLSLLDLRSGNNQNMYDFDCSNNLNLNCIDIDDVAWSIANWTVANGSVDSQHYFSTDCSVTVIEEHTTNKELLRTIDVLGRETKNNPLFYIYDDGTVEKRIVIE